MQPLTKRQQVLLDRLVTLGQWLAEGRLPVFVFEMYGFGSFFRGKGSPHDVDLLLRRSKEETKDFTLFSKLLDQVCRGDYSKRFQTPQGALLHAFDEHCFNLIPGLVDASGERALFEQWIDGYTWKMLFTSDIFREISLRSPDEIAKRFVKRNLPNLNIFHCIGPEQTPDKCGLRAGFVALLWSREKPDIRANVMATLHDDQRHRPILEDLTRFDHDVFQIEAQIGLVKKAFERLLGTSKSHQRAESHHEWLSAWTKRQKDMNPEALEKAVSWDNLIDQEAIVEMLGLEYPSPSYEGMSVEQLGELVEEKRSRLKPLRNYLEVAQEAIGMLAWYKSNQPVNERTPTEFLTVYFMHNKGRNWWKKSLAVLADLGVEVPQNRIDRFYRLDAESRQEDDDGVPADRRGSHTLFCPEDEQEGKGNDLTR